MRILLVNPFGSNWVEGQKDRTATAVRMAPVGILCIAAYLIEKGFEAEIYNSRGPAKHIGTAEIINRVLSFRPDMAGFTATTSSFLDAYLQAEAIKKVVPDIKIVFGGVHVSALREKILESYPAIDFLVTGEGEKAMAGLAEGIGPDKIEGVIFRSGGEIKSNGLRRDLCEMDKLPFPAYGKLEGFPDTCQAPLFNYPRAHSATIISSRGCLYQCSFCDRSVFLKGYRFNSAEYVYEQMMFLKKDFRVRHIFFYDDLFTLERKRIEEFCGLIQRKPLGMTFNCAVRIGHIDDELLKMLKASGCWMVSLGIESGDPDLLARHKSNINLNDLKDTVKQIQRNGIRAKGLFIMGLPGESEETIKRTGDFIEKLELDDMNMAKFTPFPGSPIYQTIREEGVFNENWDLMNCMNFVFIPKEIESKERLEELYKKFIKDFYTGKNWVRKFVPLMFKSPHSAYRMIKSLPTFLKIKNEFIP